MIITGSASQSFAAALAAATGEPLAAMDYQSFPDGELLAAAPDFESDRAIVVVSTVSSHAHIELLQLQDAVREWGATEVITIIPYLGYARQEGPYKPGNGVERGYPTSARAMARAISTGTDHVYTVNPHEDIVCEYFDVPTTAVDAASRLAEPLPADLVDPVFIAPDENAIDLARSVRDTYNRGSMDYFEKTRLSGTDVEIAPSDTNVTDRDVVVVDDIIATGTTMSKSIEVLRDRGAAQVFVTCVHPILVQDARTKFARAGVAAVYGTDTVERAVSAVSAAPVVADVL